MTPYGECHGFFHPISSGFILGNVLDGVPVSEGNPGINHAKSPSYEY